MEGTDKPSATRVPVVRALKTIATDALKADRCSTQPNRSVAHPNRTTSMHFNAALTPTTPLLARVQVRSSLIERETAKTHVSRIRN